ncbi:MAG TPA: VWA domain-containing protein [Pyrinomonadaceae bacterium]|nr:VWA domain-containing protein [Pyrinomonadaceae bacterium]
MRQRKFPARSWSAARVAAVLAVLLALASSLVPASLARRQSGGRPRRATTAVTQKAAAAQATPKPTPSKTNVAQPQQTPTPTSTPFSQTQTPAGQAKPKLQTQPTAEPDAPRQDEGGQTVDEDEVVTIDASLVTLHVRVIDRNNHPVEGVGKGAFRVFENGVEQQIQFVTTEEVPITYGLVVDNSGSLRNQIGQVIEAGKSIVASNKSGDETFVVRFVSSDEIKIMQDFTADQQSLTDALEDMFVEGGQTAVVDAVYLAAEHASEHRKGDPLEDKRRRALILVTDGEDRNSFYKTEQLFEALKEEDVQIFVIGFVNELEKDRGFISKSKRDKAVSLLDRMAKETGGRTFYPNSLSELPGIAEQITKDLRTQYVISYKPNVTARPGEFRPVRVAVADASNKEKRIAVTRSGYTGKTAPQQQQTPRTPAAQSNKSQAVPPGRRQ